MVRLLRLFIFAMLAAVSLTSIVAEAQAPGVTVLRVEGTINPVVADFVRRGIEQAEADGSTACIIELDTPGGLDSSMREIVQSILNSSIPVVVYVSPAGARAASAGTFITIAAHVAAMAPNTTIGAASPVPLGGDGEQPISDTLQEKIINDAAAYIRGLAETRGRNADWAERAVREAVSATEREALVMNVIDLVSPDLNSLMSDLEGRLVTLLDGRSVVLQTRNVAVNRVEMSIVENFLHTIADPNVAYILLTVGMLGIIAEIFNPGLVFPGVIGGISLLLSFYALGMLSVNIAGVLLIILAFGLFVAEAFTPSFGGLTAGGIAALVIGSLILFKEGPPALQVDRGLIATVAVLVAGFVAFAVWRVVKAHRRQAATGREELVGRAAVVRETLNPEGTVFLEGERWSAHSESGPISPGETVTITRIDGLKLYVVKKGESDRVSPEGGTI